MAVRLAITAMLIITATLVAQEHEHASECAGFVVGRGKVNAAAHEWEDGSWNLGQLTVSMPRGSIDLLRAKEFDGRDAELVLRPLPQRTPERLVK